MTGIVEALMVVAVLIGGSLFSLALFADLRNDYVSTGSLRMREAATISLMPLLAAGVLDYLILTA